MLKNRLRERFPALAGAYKRMVRPLIERGTPSARLDQWVVDGIDLIERQGIEALVVGADEAWLREPDGLEWLYLSGPSSLLTLKEGRAHEPVELELLASRLADSGSLVDIGANIGYLSIRLATRIRSLRVVAIEPVPDVYRALVANIGRNGVGQQVTAVQAAATAEPGSRNITIDRGPANYLLRDGGAARPGSVSVPARRIDDLLEDHGLSAPAVIKCDVEGAELPALRGAEETLRRHRPALLLEVEERWTQRFSYKPSELFRFLDELGYARSLVMPSGELVPGEDAVSDVRRTNSFWLLPR